MSIRWLSVLTCFVSITACDAAPAKVPAQTASSRTELTVQPPASSGPAVTTTPVATATPTPTPTTTASEQPVEPQGPKWSNSELEKDPQLSSLCQQRIYPRPHPGQRAKHISRWSYASRLTVTQLTAQYLKRKGRVGFAESAGGGGSWHRESKSGAQTSVHIRTMPSSGPDVDCGKPKLRGARSMLILSHH